MSERDPIESHLRDEPTPDDAVLLLRGGPVTIDKIVEHAARQMREFTRRGLPMAVDTSDAEAARLLAVFDPPEDNPFKHRRR